MEVPYDHIRAGQDPRLGAIQPVAKERLGALETPGFALTDKFYEPLPEDKLRLWNGEGEPLKPK